MAYKAGLIPDTMADRPVLMHVRVASATGRQPYEVISISSLQIFPALLGLQPSSTRSLLAPSHMTLLLRKYLTG